MVILYNLSDAGQHHAGMVRCILEALILGFTSDSDEEIQKICRKALDHFKASLQAASHLTMHQPRQVSIPAGPPAIPRLALPKQSSYAELHLSGSDATTRPPSYSSSFTDLGRSPLANPLPAEPHPVSSNNSSFELVEGPLSVQPVPWPEPQVPMATNRSTGTTSSTEADPVGQIRLNEPSTSGESWDDCTVH